MKKLLLALLMVASTSAMADKFIVERAWANDLDSVNGADTLYIKGVVDVNKNLAFDSSIQVTQIEHTNKVSSRYDIGIIPKFNIYGPIDGRVRVAVGEKWSSTGNYTTYSIEPGISSPLGAGFTGSVAYRYRDAFESGHLDQTRTLRTGVEYAITSKDAIGVRLDTMRGDQRQDIWNLNYVRSF